MGEKQVNKEVERGSYVVAQKKCMRTNKKTNRRTEQEKDIIKDKMNGSYKVEYEEYVKTYMVSVIKHRICKKYGLNK